jgi:hypothetical protein
MQHSMRSSVISAVVAVSTLLAALAVVPVAMAVKPTREIVPAPQDRVISDQCAFLVNAHIDGVEINTTFTDKAGNPVKLLGVFPGNRLTLTNLETGKSITLAATGSFQARAQPDGSTAFSVTGNGPWFPNPVSGEPGIWYQSGRVTASFDAEGNVTSVGSTGKLIDLCPQLAS